MDQRFPEDDARSGRNLVTFLLTTWTGRILTINTIVFLVMSVQSGSIFYPVDDSILSWGAKEPVAIVQGEYWRFVTPLFIHIGIIHFLFNSYILYMIGQQLEVMLGPWRFLLIFLASGILGNVASAVLSPVMSAGASSSIFGLLGCGFYIERLIRRSVEQETGLKGGNKAYAMTILINLGFGFLMPFIDNAAHVGGLIGGLLLTVAMVHMNPTPAISRIVRTSKKFGVALAILFVALTIGGGVFATNREYVTFLLEHAAESKERPAEKAFFYSRALLLSPDNHNLRLARAKILIEHGESRAGYDDLRRALESGLTKEELASFADQLQKDGFVTEAWQVRTFIR